MRECKNNQFIKKHKNQSKLNEYEKEERGIMNMKKNENKTTVELQIAWIC